MQPVQYNSKLQAYPLSPRFANTAVWVRSVGNVLNVVQKSRTREMLIEDLLGFGVLRTGMDLFRQYFFRQTEDGTRGLNLPAARERLLRETASIFTDNFSGGILAYAIAKGANTFSKAKPNFSNQFVSTDTLNLFRQLASQSRSEGEFVERLAGQFATGQKGPVLGLFKAAVNAKNPKAYPEQAIAIAQRLSNRKTTLDVVINRSTFALDSLIEDVANFLKFTRKQSLGGKSWQNMAQSAISRTASVNRWRLPISLGAAMGMTLCVPYLNHYLTRKLDGIESYPGELGLGAVKKVDKTRKKSFLERHIPYLYESWKEGKLFPTLMSLIPLPFAFGIFDTVTLSNGAGFKKAFNNPFKKGFLNKLSSMFQFGKGFPFTTQQQMASCFAFLIFSRMITARSENEFRERMIDSFLGWSIWILATPRIKKFIAERWDTRWKTQLLKQIGNEKFLKRKVEIEKLLPKNIANKTLGKYTILSAASILITIALLGIVEPWIAIKWTEFQARKAKPQKYSLA